MGEYGYNQLHSCGLQPNPKQDIRFHQELILWCKLYKHCSPELPHAEHQALYNPEFVYQ